MRFLKKIYEQFMEYRMKKNNIVKLSVHKGMTLAHILSEYIELENQTVQGCLLWDFLMYVHSKIDYSN